jgi:DNA repair protein RadA/Sms
MGKCPDCGEWQSFVEEAKATKGRPGFASGTILTRSQPIAIDAIKAEDENRLTTGISEFDRVLGGGLVSGTLILIGGDPGIGKSTLMLQVLFGIARQGKKVLYVSGEESVKQLSLRSRRLATVSPNILVVSEIDIDAILAMVESEKPDVLVIDSIQTMYSSELTSAPGSVSQVRESAMRLMLMAKNKGVPTFSGGSRDQGRGHCRAPAAGTHGGHGALLRGGPEPRVQNPAGRKEPVRLHKRDRRVRNERPWAG